MTIRGENSRIGCSTRRRGGTFFFRTLTTLCLSALVACQAGAATPTPTPVPSTAGGSGFSGAFFALSVPDATTSAKWYAEKLGLKITMRPPKANKATVIVLEGDGLIVELIQNDDGVELSQVAPSVKDRLLVHGVIKAGAIVRDLDATLAMLRQRQVEIAFGPFPATPQERANVIIRDNDGNLIQFFGGGA